MIRAENFSKLFDKKIFYEENSGFFQNFLKFFEIIFFNFFEFFSKKCDFCGVSYRWIFKRAEIGKIRAFLGQFLKILIGPDQKFQKWAFRLVHPHCTILLVGVSRSSVKLASQFGLYGCGGLPDRGLLRPLKRGLLKRERISELSFNWD